MAANSQKNRPSYPSLRGVKRHGSLLWSEDKNPKAQNQIRSDLHAHLSAHTCGCGDVGVQSASARATHHAEIARFSPAGSPRVTNGPIVLAVSVSEAHDGNTVIQ